MHKIIPIPAFHDNYIWLLFDEQTRDALVVDPGDAQPVLAELKQRDLNLVSILITHHHYDHTGGINPLLQHYDVPVYAPKTEMIKGTTHPLQEGDQIYIDALNLKFDILDIGAHTRGHIAYYGHGLVFCGDTLFAGGCGRLFEGDAHNMQQALKKLMALPDETKVYCAHEYTQQNLRFALTLEPNNKDLIQRMEHVNQLRLTNQVTLPSTIALEKKTNPFVRTKIPQVIESAEKSSGKHLQTSEQVLASIRALKDNFT